MADKSFALPPDDTGFDRYVDIVKNILQIYLNIRNGIYDPDNSGGDTKDNLDSLIANISDLTTTNQTTPTGYAIDTEGNTQIALLQPMLSLKRSITEGNAKRSARFYVYETVKALQLHLVDLIQESTSYDDINDYYSQNQTERGSADNIFNGGYHFTSDWNELSQLVNVPYDSVYDID